MTISNWFQGQYSNGSYNGDNQYISSGMTSITNVVTSITRDANTSPVVLEQWRRVDSSSQWYHNTDVESTDTSMSIYFFDVNYNAVGSGMPISAGQTIELSNKETAVYILVTVEVGTDVVNKNIHPKDADPPEDYPSNFYYKISTDFECSYTS